MEQRLAAGRSTTIADPADQQAQLRLRFLAADLRPLGGQGEGANGSGWAVRWLTRS